MSIPTRCTRSAVCALAASGRAAIAAPRRIRNSRRFICAGRACRLCGQRRASIYRATGGNRPELLDAVAADADIPVVEVDGRVAVAGDQPDLVAEPEPVGGGGDGKPSMLVGGALVGRGGLVADERRPRIEGERLEPGVDDRPVLGRPAHHRRPDEETRLEGREGAAVAVV